MVVGVAGAPGPPALWAAHMELRPKPGPAPTLHLSMEATTAWDLTRRTSNVSKSTALVSKTHTALKYLAHCWSIWLFLGRLCTGDDSCKWSDFRGSGKDDIQMERRVSVFGGMFPVNSELTSCSTKNWNWAFLHQHKQVWFLFFSLIAFPDPLRHHHQEAAWDPRWDVLLTALPPQPAGPSTWIPLETASWVQLQGRMRLSTSLECKEGLRFSQWKVQIFRTTCKQQVWGLNTKSS